MVGRGGRGWGGGRGGGGGVGVGSILLPSSVPTSLPYSVCACARFDKKDDVTELHCVHRLKSKARGSEDLPTKEEQELADTWVSLKKPCCVRTHGDVL